MINWKYSSNRKKHQRAINTIIRKVNKSLLDDDLWAGRFYIKQGSYTHWWQFEDKSGWNLYVVLEMCDRLTGNKKEIGDEVNSFCRWNGNKLFLEMNTFIVEECDVWHQDPRPNTPQYNEMINHLKDKNNQIHWPY